jgi:hypothetical protein
MCRGLELQHYSNEANWAQDGHILMQPYSHFNFFVRSLLQLCSYLVQQLPSQYKITIKPDVFLSAFTMEADGERVQATPWPGAPDGSAYDTNVEQPDNNNTEALSAIPSSLLGQPLGLQTGQFNSIVLKRQLALQWIERQKQCYQFLPVAVDQEPDWEHIRNKINLGPHGARQAKATKAVKGTKGRIKCTGFKITSH